MKKPHNGTRARLPRAVITFFATLAVIASSALGIMVTAAPANAATAGDGISYTLEGCKNDGTITLPNGGKFICPDTAYTTGNLGKGWNELDLVPLRVTVQAGNSAPATQNFAFAVAVDNCADGSGATGCPTGVPGYDVLSSDSGGTPVLNTTLSSAAGCGTLASSSPQYAAPGLGGVGTTLYRVLSVTGQAKNTTCVYDAFARLAIGSHAFPGSSLHFNLANDTLGTSGVGSKEVSIPVKEITPQSISKDMSATQNSDFAWDVTKSATPATITFANTCSGADTYSQGVAIKVTWTKKAVTPTGPITIITHVYATNPAARVVTVDVTDNIRSGTTVLDTVTSGAKDVPANTANFLVLTHTTTVPSGTTNLNDVATATYTDKATGLPVPGTTQATASATVTPSGSSSNSSAVISDVESLTGTGLQFSVDSTSGASGTYGNGYTLGTKTVGPVTWTSGIQSDSGSVTFNKTIYSPSAIVTTGKLSDTATLTGSDGFTTQASLDVNISTNATGSATVTKTASLSIAQQLVFTFHLLKGGVDTGSSTTATLPASSKGPVGSGTLTGLDVTGSYAFAEDATAPYGAQTTGAKTFSLVAGQKSTCALTFPVTNSAPAASARVKKDTLPVSSGNWTFTLTGPNGLSEKLTDVAAGSGYNAFTSSLDVDGGTYTITETQQAGYDLTGLTGDVNGVAARVTTDKTARTCSFTLDLTIDSGKILSCNFVNTLRGRIIVTKYTDPPGSIQEFTFTSSYGPNFTLTDGKSNDSGLLVPGTYSVAELTPTGWDQTGAICDDGSKIDAIKLDPGETVHCDFTNTQRGTIIVKKITDPTTATDTFTFTGDAAGQIGNGGSIVVSGLKPGTYTSTEAVPAGWDLTGLVCDDSNSTGDLATAKATFKLDAGETVTCTFTDTERGKIIVKKITNPTTATDQFTFTGDAAGQIGNGGSIVVGNLKPGTYFSTETVPAGWDLTGLVCDDTNSSGDLGTAKATFKLDPGETVTCTFTNTQRGTIIVKKITNPTSATDQFTFTGDAAGKIGNGETITKGNLVPGTYFSTETVPAGWDLTGLVCDDTNSSGDLGTAKATFKL
ncbi:prealbumin-like fold domain-containing protein, partial [Humibacillus xanthopallidus]|uniref:prealbumin-like fold domain-containing protein n=1 Tax=Humibacillus xanthopallidus TaxID=412689 RepID=UPI0031D22AA2